MDYLERHTRSLLIGVGMTVVSLMVWWALHHERGAPAGWPGASVEETAAPAPGMRVVAVPAGETLALRLVAPAGAVGSHPRTFKFAAGSGWVSLRSGGEDSVDTGEITVGLATFEASDPAGREAFLADIARWLGVAVPPVSAELAPAKPLLCAELGLHADPTGVPWEVFALSLATTSTESAVFLRVSVDGAHAQLVKVLDAAIVADFVKVLASTLRVAAPGTAPASGPAPESALVP